jgi:1-acyl-sn-glycerol-3-phosphate acyltransferase
MLRSVIRFWRVFGTGLGFLAIGVGGVLVFPLINVFVPRRQRRTDLARDLIGFTFRCIVRSMRAMGVFEYEITGLERLQRRGLLILANHPTLIDIVFLMAFVKRADCIVKGALWRNPFTHCTVRAAAYIRNDGNGARLVEQCVAAIRGGNNVIIFPEGTRTPCDGSIALKRGAANVAVRALRSVTPVLIRCKPLMLAKGAKWWRLPSKPSFFNIAVNEDIDVLPFVVDAGSEVLAARRLTEYLRTYFAQEASGHAVA